MKTAEFLTDLRSLGVEIQLKGDRLTCNAPKDALTAELRRELSTRKAEILSFLRQAEEIAATPTVTIQPAPRDGNLPLSFAQERLWLLNQFAPDNPMYNLLFAVRLRGELDESLFEQCWVEILQRHEALRTTFKRVDNQPVQIIAEFVPSLLSIISLEELPEIEREAEALQILNQEVQRPFKLEEGPLFRVKLVRLNQDERLLVVVIHHIIADGWSLEILMKEWGTLYKAFLQGQPSSLPKLPIQFADFAYWQKQWLQGEVLENQLAYWKQQLKGNIPVLKLPISQSASLTPSSQGSYQVVEFSKEFSTEIETVSRQEGLSVFMTLLTAFQVLVNRYTGQEDLVICLPSAGRKGVETEGVVGYFNNIVVLRTDLSGNPSFRELLGRVREGVLGAYDHQDVPFQTVAELPNLARIPLSKTLFSLEESFANLLELPGIEISSLFLDNQAADFDLGWLNLYDGSRFKIMTKYKTDLFNESDISEILENFQRVLENIIRDPSSHLFSLPYFRQINLDTVVEVEESNLQKTFVAPSNELEIQLTKMWEETLGIKPIGIKDNFFELGGHSLNAARLFFKIQEKFDKTLPLATLFQTPTIEGIANILQQKEWSAPWSSLVPIQPNGSKRPLFCIHAVGGNVLSYQVVAHYLGQDQPVYGLQSRGLDGKSQPHTTIEEMARDYIKEIRSVQPKGPYCLTGHSFGGIVAFEIAQQLVAAGEKVGLLALLDTFSPTVSTDVPSLSYQFYIHRLNLSRFKLKDKFLYVIDRILWMFEKLGDKIFKKFYQWFPGKNGDGIPEHFKVIEANNFQSQYTYEPKIYPGKVTVLRAIERPTKEYYEPFLGWGDLAAGGVDIVEVPGHHKTLILEPRVQSLAKALNECLDKV